MTIPQNPLSRFLAHSQRPMNQSILWLRYFSQFGIGPSQRAGCSISIIDPLLNFTSEWNSQMPRGRTSSVTRYHADKHRRHHALHKRNAPVVVTPLFYTHIYCDYPSK